MTPGTSFAASASSAREPVPATAAPASRPETATVEVNPPAVRPATRPLRRCAAAPPDGRSNRNRDRATVPGAGRRIT